MPRSKALAVKKKDSLKIQQLAKNLPAWIPEKENVGNSMFDAGQEMLLVIDDILTRYYGFTEEKLKDFHKKAKEVLTGAKEFERSGLSMLSQHSMSLVGEMHEEGKLLDALAELAEIRERKHEMQKAGLEYPVLPAAKPFIKKLKEVNK